MIDVEIITIDDKRYIIVNKITNNDTTYLYLINEVDDEDFLIQKYDSTKENIVSLDDEAEFDKALLLFSEE